MECGGGSGTLQDSPSRTLGRSSNKEASHVETRGALFGPPTKPHVVVFAARPLRSDPWKPKREFRLGSRGLSGSIFCVCAHLSACLRGGGGSACVRVPLFVQGGFQYWDVLGGLEVAPILQGCGQWNRQRFLGESGHSPVVWLQRPQPGGCVGQGCGDRRPKTQTGLRFGADVMAGPVYRA